MTIRNIKTLPDLILKRKTIIISKFDKELQVLIDDMIETMREAPGVGLAAPQVGVPIRLIVVEYPEDDELEESPKKLYVLVNPEIKDISEETEMGIEGCLSIPNLHGEVERALAVTVKGQTRHGQLIKIKAKGWLARIFQHEIDHLNGIVFTDRATKVWKPAADEPVLDNV
jgi:peptide deformylase